MDKARRQEKLVELIRLKKIKNQQQLLTELKQRGTLVTQASISRDLVELGIIKMRGMYTLPSAITGKTPMGEILEIDSAGENLLVVKTPPGQASMTALAVDREKVPGIVGTVAGDDTFFVATKSYSEQKMVMKQIYKMIR